MGADLNTESPAVNWSRGTVRKATLGSSKCYNVWGLGFVITTPGPLSAVCHHTRGGLAVGPATFLALSYGSLELQVRV